MKRAPEITELPLPEVDQTEPNPLLEKISLAYNREEMKNTMRLAKKKKPVFRS